MRIDPNLVVAPVTSDAPKPQAKAAPSNGSATVVSLSTAGAAVVAETADDSAVKTAKIARLRGQVVTGTYKVDYDTLAQRIVDDEVVGGG